MVLVAVAAVGAALLMAGAVGSRQRAANAVATQSGPLLVQADELYASLADADATAATTFLTGGQEPPARRRRYLQDLRSASARLSNLAREVGDSSDAGAAVSQIATLLPVYSGSIEAARANNRQGFPIGAAYLREASDVMRGRILPAAGRLYAFEAQKLGDSYKSGTSWNGIVAFGAGAVLILAVLIAIQVALARRMRRNLNIPMAVATVLLIGLAAWGLAAMATEQRALGDAQRKGSDSVEVLSAARILSLRAQADEGLALVARGGGGQNLAEFDLIMRRLRPDGGLLGEAARLAERAGSAEEGASTATAFASYRAAHGRVAALQDQGRYADAVRLAVAVPGSESARAARLDATLAAQVAAAQKRFERAASRATSALSGLRIAIILIVAVSALLALAGLQLRMNEYR